MLAKPPRPLYFVPLALIVTACGGRQPVRDSKSLSEQVAAAALQLPPAPPDHLWGDGFGGTAHEAVLDARRAVAEQIVAKVESVTEARASETNGKGEAEARTHVRSTSDFEHAELIRTLRVIERPGGFAARASLSRSRTAKLYQAEVEAAHERLKGLLPTVEAALGTLDTSVLLSAEHSPGTWLRRLQRKGQILSVLGRGDAARPPVEALRLEKRAAVARRRAVLRLTVSGKVPPRVRQGAVAEIARTLRERGCRIVEGRSGPPEAGVPTADLALRLSQRTHLEQGLDWRYLGLELRIQDARSKRPVMRFSGLPEFVHAGGKGWAKTDEALRRRLREKLAEKADAAFAQLTCD
jgi:hypothetical protein